MAFEKEFENLFRSFAELREQQAKTDKQLAENAKQQAKTDEQIRTSQAKTDKQLAKTDEQLAKTDEQIRTSQAKTDEQMKRTDEKLQKLSKELGNIGNNNGDAAEEFFWNGLKNKKEFEGIKIDYTEANVKPPIKKGIQDEFDILLWNGNSVVIVETKYKVHPNVIQQMKEKKIPNFKTLIPDRKDHKIYCAIAGFVIPEEIAQAAKEEGFFIIRQSAGNNMLIEKGEIKAY